MIDPNQSNKTAFLEWLSAQEGLVMSAKAIVASLDEGSYYAVDHGVLKTAVWYIDNEQEVRIAFQKVLAPFSWFCLTHRKRKVKDLESALVYYQRFLRERQQSIAYDRTLLLELHKGSAEYDDAIVEKQRIESNNNKEDPTVQAKTFQETETIFEMHKVSGEYDDLAVKNNADRGSRKSIDSVETSDQAGSSKEKVDEDQPEAEREDERDNNRHIGYNHDDEIRKRDPELYDLVYYVLLKLQREQPNGVLFIDIYNQIGRSFTEIKKILWTASWVAQQGRRFLLKPGAVLHQQFVSHDGGEGENKLDSAATTRQMAEEPETPDTEAVKETITITEEADCEVPTTSSTLENADESALNELSEEQDEEGDEDIDEQSTSLSLMAPLKIEKEDSSLEDEEGLADRLYALLKTISDKNKFGTTLYYLAATVHAPQAIVKAVLDGSNWAKCEYNRYRFNYDAIEDVMKYDFIKPQSLAYTKPLSLTYFEETVLKPSSWRQLFLEFMRLINEDYPHYINDLRGIVFGGASLPIIADKGTAKQMREPKEFADGLYIETNRSANDLMANMRRILDACYVDYENVVIRYTAKSAETNGTGVILSYESVIDKKGNSITIEDAIHYVLSNAFEPLTIQEIYDQIEYDTAYHFTAKDPLHYLRTKIEMHCQGSGYVEQIERATTGVIDISGEKKYYLLSKGELIIQRAKGGSQERKQEQKKSSADNQSKIDSFLAKKYPILFTRVYYALKGYGRNGTTIHSLMSRVGKVARTSTIKQILEYASWSKKIDDVKYQFSSTPVIHNVPKDLLESQTVVIEKKAKPEKPPVQKSAATLQKAATDEHLGSAHTIVTEDGFFHYMLNTKRMAENSCKGYLSAVRTSEKYAFQKGFSPWRIFNVDSLTSISVIQTLLNDKGFATINESQHYRFSAAFAKLKDYIGAELFDDKGTPPSAAEPKNDNESTSMPTFDKERYIKVLMQRYRNGMMFDSIDYDNFRDTYEMLFDETLDVEDAVLEKQLRFCGVVYMDRLFPAEGIIDNQTKEKLYQYIESSFSSGKQVLYYKAIFADLASDFTNCYVLRDANMLRAYLEFTAEPGRYFFFDDYMAKERFVKIDHNAEIADRLLTEGKPMKIDDLCAALSHIPSDQIRRIITTDKQFVWNAKGEYFHRDIFEVTDEELEKIAGIIDYYIAENGYVIWTDVWLDIKAQMPGFIENNLYLSSYGVREILARRFSRRFSFNAAVISLPQDNLQMWKVYQLFAKHHSTFTADELYNLSKELNSVIYFEAIFEVSVRVSRDLFVSKKQIIFDVAEIDKAIESFMSKDYIKIKEIDSFLAFPYVGFEWNEYLLESFLLSYSKRFILLNNGTALNNVAGAIVKRDSAIKEFVDVCAAVLADSSVSLKKNEALDYLVEANMITRRSYRYIEEALRKAAQIRGVKG